MKIQDYFRSQFKKISMKKRSINGLLFLLLLLLMVSCDYSYENNIKITCPAQMDYLGLFVFNCEATNIYPIASNKSLTRIQGKIQFASYSMMDPNYCLVIDDIALWMRDEDRCLGGLNDFPFDDNFGKKPILISILGYFSGEKVNEVGEKRKFTIVDIPDYRYICCYICCSDNHRSCFWYKPGDEKPFPYENTPNVSYFWRIDSYT